MSDRFHCTRVGTQLSSSAPIKSGVVQGSCIGPVLFVLFINDIVDKLNGHTHCKLFADDVKLYASINIGIINLQDSLNAIFSWALEWQLDISILKCCIIVLNRNNRSIFDYNIHFTLEGAILPYKSVVRDLGVLVDSQLNFNNHIANITSKAHQRASLIFRCFVSQDPKLLIKAYKTYVRPLLEYNCQVWNPYTISNIFKIEQVQKQFTKRIPGYSYLTYAQRLHSLNLESLELRRLRADLLFTYKLIFNNTGMSYNDYFYMQNNNSYGMHLRRHSYQIRSINHFNTVRSDHCLFNRIPLIWNSLPPQTDFSSLSKFRSTLTPNVLSIYLKCNFC